MLPRGPLDQAPSHGRGHGVTDPLGGRHFHDGRLIERLRSGPAPTPLPHRRSWRRQRAPPPGEVTLAHTACCSSTSSAISTRALDAQRQPLEEGSSHSRVPSTLEFPPSSSRRVHEPVPVRPRPAQCTCSDVQRDSYRRRLSAPPSIASTSGSPLGPGPGDARGELGRGAARVANAVAASAPASPTGRGGVTPSSGRSALEARAAGPDAETHARRIRLNRLSRPGCRPDAPSPGRCRPGRRAQSTHHGGCTPLAREDVP